MHGLFRCMYFIHCSGLVADRISLRYFLTTGMIGQLTCELTMYIYMCVAIVWFVEVRVLGVLLMLLGFFHVCASQICVCECMRKKPKKTRAVWV